MFEEICTSEELTELTIECKGKEYKFRLRELPWLTVTNAVSEAMSWKRDGTVKFDFSRYMTIILEKMIVEAPWEKKDTGLMLKRLGSEFGAKLQSFVPLPFAFGEEEDELKKELTES